jgi:hypothetical protein
MDQELLSELMNVTDKITQKWSGEARAAIITAYATIRAAQITAAGKPEKEDVPYDAY